VRAHKTKTVAAIGPALGLFFACLAFDVRAELPPADAVLEDVGYSAHEIADIEAGKIVTADVKPVHERDLAVAFAFFVSAPPAELVNELKAGLMAKVEPSTIAHGQIFGPASPADFASLTLQPDAERRAARYVAANPDTDLNLSADEIAARREIQETALLNRAFLMPSARIFESRVHPGNRVSRTASIPARTSDLTQSRDCN